MNHNPYSTESVAAISAAAEERATFLQRTYLMLLAGVGTRLVALSFVGIMLGAIVTVHAQHGFFMNWAGAQSGEGFEYHLLVIGQAVALVVLGGGRWSVDRRLTAR